MNLNRETGKYVIIQALVITTVPNNVFVYFIYLHILLYLIFWCNCWQFSSFVYFLFHFFILITISPNLMFICWAYYFCITSTIVFLRSVSTFLSLPPFFIVTLTKNAKESDFNVYLIRFYNSPFEAFYRLFPSSRGNDK